MYKYDVSHPIPILQKTVIGKKFDAHDGKESLVRKPIGLIFVEKLFFSRINAKRSRTNA